MKKILISMVIMTGVIIGAQQFITKKDPSTSCVVKPKELFYDLIELEKRIPSLLHKTAYLLGGLHGHVEACFDGDKNACIKKKDSKSRDVFKQAIVAVNDAMDNLELNITRLINLLKIDNAVAIARDTNLS